MSNTLTKTILGLDLGTSSIGWCLLEGNPIPKRIVDMGVRIFPEGVDRTKGEQSLNQERREARSLRRQGYRRVRRKTKLLNALQDAKLMPKGGQALLPLYQLDPYQLRARALDEHLEPFEVGRALYHLGQRRGYLSNRKAGNEKEDGAVSGGIGKIDKAMQAGGFRTLGEYFNSIDPHQARIRGNYTARHMYEKEFDLIWEKQATYHPKLMDVANRKRIHAAIFDQRPLKMQKNLVGMCEFETDRKRAAGATLAAQEFRLWQDLNNLKVLFADGQEWFLADKERLTLYKKLQTEPGLSWRKAKETLGFPGSSTQFNLEKVRKSGLLGNRTAAALSKALGKKQWKALGKRDQEDLAFDLINIADEEGLKKRLRRRWRFDEKIKEKLISTHLQRGYMHLSHKAIRNILPHLKWVSTPDDKGLTYSQACAKAGYEHTKPAVKMSHSELIYPGKAARDKPAKKANHGEKVLGNHMVITDLRNPMVERALYQVRKVVNAIIRKYGKPDIIRVEMARDLKANRRQRDEIIKHQKENEKLNEEAEKKLKESKINPTRTDKLKYRLWQECNHECPYTRKPISWGALFGDHPQFDIEHIIPYQRCLDDSYMNKTLCEREENARKGKLTPHELYAGDEARYADVLQRAKKLPYPKFKRFAQDATKDLGDFVSQQINETRYIAKKTVEFLGQLGVDVQPVKGHTTAILRRAWGLSGILSSDGEKTRLDHRHHAIDALVIALTDRSAVQKLSRYHRESERGLRIEGYPEPMPDIRKCATGAVERIIVSHKTNRKIQGAFHNEFLYGLTGKRDNSGSPEVVIRKPLKGLGEKGLDNIRDNHIRELAKIHLQNSKDFKDAFENPDKPFGIPTKDDRLIPVRKIRVIDNRSVQSIGPPMDKKGNRRNVWTRNNHHMEIVECQDKKGRQIWKGIIVTTLEAAMRSKTKVPIVQKDHGDQARFITALHKNDMVILTYKGQRIVCRVNGLSDREIELRIHSDATKNKSDRIRITSWKTLIDSDMRLLDVDALGISNEQTDH